MSVLSTHAGSGFNTTTGTNHFAATAECSSFSDGGTEHGPFGLNAPSLPLNGVEALLQVGGEDLGPRSDVSSAPSLYVSVPQFCPASSPSPDPTHHQVVISRHLSPSLYPSVSTYVSKSDDTITKSITKFYLFYYLFLCIY